MKSQILISMLLLVLTVRSSPMFFAKDNQPNEILVELSNAIRAINSHYALIIERKESDLMVVNLNLASSSNLEEKINLLIKKNQVEAFLCAF